jgi:hypothetical protein
MKHHKRTWTVAIVSEHVEETILPKPDRHSLHGGRAEFALNVMLLLCCQPAQLGPSLCPEVHFEASDRVAHGSL